MIIGNGLIAKAFSEYSNNDNIIIFASGVANSKETDQLAFEKERSLLHNIINTFPERKLVYFSTTSVYDQELKDYPYLQHKKNMEELISTSCQHYLVLRLSEVIGYTKNSNQLLPFLIKKICTGEKFEVWEKACRRLLHVDDVVLITTELINNEIDNDIIDMASPKKVKLLDLVHMIEDYCGRSGNYVLKPIGGCYDIDNSKISLLSKEYHKLENTNYVQNIIKKTINDLRGSGK